MRKKPRRSAGFRTGLVNKTIGANLLASLLIACLAGCAASGPPPPGHLDPHLAVLPVHNRTGDPLLVAGSGLLDGYLLRSPEIGVGDVLAGEARAKLKENGFEVTDQKVVESALAGRHPTGPESAMEGAERGGLRQNCLYLEIRRWEADVPVHVRSVSVSVTAWLIDPSARRILWKARRGPSPIPTAGDLTLESAYVTAARQVVEEMLAPLHPRPPSSR